LQSEEIAASFSISDPGSFTAAGLLVAAP